MEREIEQAVKQCFSNYLRERTCFVLFFSPFVSIKYQTSERRPWITCSAIMALSHCSKWAWILSSNLGTYLLADQKPMLRDWPRFVDALCCCLLPGSMPASTHWAGPASPPSTHREHVCNLHPPGRGQWEAWLKAVFPLPRWGCGKSGGTTHWMDHHPASE